MKPPELGFPYEAYEIPLLVGPTPELKWSLVICMMGKGDNLIGATIFNCEAQRGSYFKTGINKWELTQFDHLVGEEPIPLDVLRMASSRLGSMLGPTFQVSHSTLPPNITDYD